MKRTIRTTLVMAVLLGVNVAPVGAARHSRAANVITAKAAILIDNQTGDVLWQRNPDLPLPPASTTKIVTAMLAVQSGRLDESLGVTPEAAQAQPSKISLRPGWRMRLRDLVYAVLLNSANDASVVIAEGLAGSVQNFAERMNVQARALGATNTHFVNPNGLPAADHYSTARDLATMFSHAMANPLFEQVVNTKTTQVVPTAGSFRRITLRNHNRLLGNYRIHVVGKTGWTIAAKKCFVGAASADGHDVVFAILGSRDLWGDLKRLVEYGLDGAPAPVPDPAEVQVATGSTPGSSAAGDEEIDSVQTTRYAVRLATFGSLQNATRFRNTVASNGFVPRIEKLHRGRTVRYTVSVGPYPNRPQAERAASKLKKTHRHLEPIVVSTS